VKIDITGCQGHGRCYETCPEVFAPDLEGFATLIPEVDPSPFAPAVRRAAALCPERAITVAE
jgi:ferredoxin